MSKKLIDAEYLKSIFQEENPLWEAMRGLIDQLEGVDPVHAAGGVYCRECSYWSKTIKGLSDERVCNRTSFGRLDGLHSFVYTKPNDFCSCGKMREEKPEEGDSP